MSNRASRTGGLLVLDHAVELLAVLVLLSLCLALGLAVLERGRVGTADRPLARLVAGLLVGIGTFASMLLLLGIIGGFRPGTMALLTIALGAVVWRRFGEAFELVKRCSSLLRSSWDVASFGVLVLIAVGLLIQSSAPPADWDSLVYHLEVPRAWLAEGRLHLPIDNLHAALTGLLHLLYVPLLALGAESGPATLNAVLACVLALTLFEFGDRFFDRRTGRIACIAVFGSASVVFVAVTPRVDVSLTLFLVFGLYALYATLFGAPSPAASGSPKERDASARDTIYLAAAVLGLATGIKLLALPWLVALLPIGIWAVVRNSGGLEEAASLAAGGAAVFLLAAAPGILFRWQLAEAPLYPALSPRLVEPWLRPWYGSGSLPADVSLLERTLYTRRPVSLEALLLHPGTLTPEREGAFYFPNPVLWLTPVALLRLRNGRLAGLLAVSGLFMGFVLLQGQGGRTNLRYLIPALALLTLVAAELLSWTYVRLRAKSVGRALVGTLLAIGLVPTVLAFTFQWSEMPTFSYLGGAISAETYLTRNEDPDVYLWARTSQWLDRRLSPDDRVLMLFEGRGFRLQTPKIQDNLMANWPLLAQRRVSGDCLARARITHVLINYGVLDVHLSHGMPPEAVAWSEFIRFAKECLEREAVHPPYVLYKVLGGEAPSDDAENPGEDGPT